MTSVPYRPLRIAVGHQARVGKDTFADITTKYLGEIERFAFADQLRHACTALQSTLGVPVEKDPGLLQLIGEGLRRHYGQDFWIKPVIEDIKMRAAQHPDRTIVVTDVRYLNEAAALRAEGFTLIKICRRNRPIDRDRCHPSENGMIDGDFDYVIMNEGSLDDYARSCICMIEQLIETANKPPVERIVI